MIRTQDILKHNLHLNTVSRWFHVTWKYPRVSHVMCLWTSVSLTVSLPWRLTVDATRPSNATQVQWNLFSARYIRISNHVSLHTTPDIFMTIIFRRKHQNMTHTSSKIQPYVNMNKAPDAYVNIADSIKEFVKWLSVTAFVKDHRFTKLLMHVNRTLSSGHKEYFPLVMVGLTLVMRRWSDKRFFKLTGVKMFQSGHVRWLLVSKCVTHR